MTFFHAIVISSTLLIIVLTNPLIFLFIIYKAYIVLIKYMGLIPNDISDVVIFFDVETQRFMSRLKHI